MNYESEFGLKFAQNIEIYIAMNFLGHKNSSHCLLVMMIGLLGIMPATHAAVVITPTGATSTTTIGGSRTIDAAIDGTLLSSGGLSADILSETVSAAGSSGHWLSASTAVDDSANFRSTTEVLTFDLGGTYDVAAVHIWPYIRPERNRGLESFDLSFSSDGTNFSGTINVSGWTIGNSSGTMPVQTQTFGNVSGVTHLRMTNLTTFGSTSYIALSEIRFGMIPEPSVFLLSGLGGLLLLSRRRA